MQRNQVNRLTLRVRVKPNARESVLVQEATNSWIAKVRARPVGGQANAEVIALIARHFACAKSAVSIKRGASSRIKWIQLELPPQEQARL